MGRTIVTCTNCSAEFSSPIAFGNKEAFETATLSGNTAKCPECGTIVSCNKENMTFIK